MPGPAIAQYLQQHTYEAFNEVVTVFRHDFVQYMGMVHSWMTLIDAEVVAAPDTSFANPTASQPFRQAVSELRQAVEDMFNDTTSRLRPTIPLINLNPGATTVYISECWDRFFYEFTTSVLTRLSHLEERIRSLVKQADFESVIERTLGAAVEEPIQDMILRPFKRLREMLNADFFDNRMAEVLNSRKNSSSAAVL